MLRSVLRCHPHNYLSKLFQCLHSFSLPSCDRYAEELAVDKIGNRRIVEEDLAVDNCNAILGIAFASVDSHSLVDVEPAFGYAVDKVFETVVP